MYFETLDLKNAEQTGVMDVSIVKNKNRLGSASNFIAQFLFGAILLAVIAPAIAGAAEQRTFESPQAAVSALIDAMKNNDKLALRALFGKQGIRLLTSDNAIDDEQHRGELIKAYSEASKVVFEGDTQATILLGKDEWPMPIPLVKYANGWHFDAVKGKIEIIKRRIGHNELAAIQVCLEIVDAEHEYSASHLDSDGVPVYAQQINSNPGKHDGLYWPTQANEAPSPLGAYLAAADEGAASKLMHRNSFHGYHYRILTRGEDAPAGNLDYLLKGKMIGGFAVVAYPAKYGSTGVKSFLVSHKGWVYEKDLGQNTKNLAAAITTFKPGTDWVKLDQK